MVYPREILINKNVQVFYGNFRLEANIYILFIIKHGKFWLVLDIASRTKVFFVSGMTRTDLHRQKEESRGNLEQNR